MKLKYIKGGTVIFLLFALMGVLAIVSGFMQNDYGILQKLFCVIAGIVFFAIAITPIILRHKKYKNIEKVQIVNIDEKTSVGSAVTRAAVGNIVAGPVGGVIGASTAKGNQKTTFLITYKNGKKDKKIVPNDSLDYNRYIKLAE